MEKRTVILRRICTVAVCILCVLVPSPLSAKMSSGGCRCKHLCSIQCRQYPHEQS